MAEVVKKFFTGCPKLARAGHSRMPKGKRRPRPARTVLHVKIMRVALSHGKESASAVLEQRGKTLAAGASRSCFLIAEGDSWFD
jgi:hypothetical protein